MGRKRSFDETAVVSEAAGAFLIAGYEGTSVDELVRATGLLRGSLYQAFGSKRGLFLAVLRQAAAGPLDETALDLLLVATLELAPRDAEVRTLVGQRLAACADPARLLGERLLERADLTVRTDAEERENR